MSRSGTAGKMPVWRMCWSWVACCWLCCSLAHAQGESIRTWTDATGQHKMQAEYVTHDSQKVTLRGADGQTYQVELSQLSSEDRKYAESHVGGIPSAAPARMPGAEAPRPPVDPSEPPPRLGEPGLGGSAVRGPKLTITPPVEGWKYTPQGLDKLGFVPKDFALPKFEFAERMERFAITQSGQFGVLTSWVSGGRATRVVIVDMKAGRMKAQATAVGEYVAIALSDSGDRVLIQMKEFVGGNNELSVFRFNGKELLLEMQILPFMDRSDRERAVKWADFVGKNRLAIMGVDAGFSLWDLETKEEVCHIPLSRGAAARSFDGQTVALASGNELALLDVNTLKFQGVTSCPFAASQLAFSPSGKRLAAASSAGVMAWDAATGEVVSHIPELNIDASHMNYVHENFLLVSTTLSGHVLVDLESQLKLWSYTGEYRTATAAGVAFFVVERRNRGDSYAAFFGEKLPEQRTLKALAEARNQPDLFLVEPGGTIKLDVSGIPEAHRERIQQALMKQLDANRMTLADDALSTLTAKIDGPTRTPAKYRERGTGVVQDVNINLATSSLVISSKGKVIWSRQATNQVNFVDYKQGESLQAKLDEKMKDPNLELFMTVQLPKLVQKPRVEGSKGVTLGSTAVQ